MAGRNAAISSEERIEFTDLAPELVEKKVERMCIQVERCEEENVVRLIAETEEYEEDILVVKANGVIQLCELCYLKKYFQLDKDDKVRIEPGCYVGD